MTARIGRLCILSHFLYISATVDITARGGFNGKPLVQWPTRPLVGWVLEAPGLGGP